jgi:hypothetical protein
MNQDKAIDPKSPIDPTKTTNKGNVELTEEQLGKASGAGKIKFDEFTIKKTTDKASP